MPLCSKLILLKFSVVKISEFASSVYMMLKKFSSEQFSSNSLRLYFADIGYQQLNGLTIATVQVPAVCDAKKSFSH